MQSISIIERIVLISLLIKKLYFSADKSVGSSFLNGEHGFSDDNLERFL